MKPSLEMILRTENQQLRDAQAVMAGFLVSLLREKHCGRAFVSLSTIAEVQSKPYQIKGEAQPELGNLCLTVIGPNGSPEVMDDAKPPEEFHMEQLPPALSDETPTAEVCQSCGRSKDEGNIHDDWCDDTHGPDDDCDEFICEDEFHGTKPCSGSWHSSSDRMGFCCPECGSSEAKDV